MIALQDYKAALAASNLGAGVHIASALETGEPMKLIVESQTGRVIVSPEIREGEVPVASVTRRVFDQAGECLSIRFQELGREIHYRTTDGRITALDRALKDAHFNELLQGGTRHV